MPSNELENLVSALKAANIFTAQENAFMNIVCDNLTAIAEQVRMLEDLPVILEN